MRLKLQNALKDNTLRISTGCHKIAINTQYKSDFNVGEVVWAPYGGDLARTSNQMNRRVLLSPRSAHHLAQPGAL